MSEFLKQLEKLQNSGVLEKFQNVIKNSEVLTNKLSGYAIPVSTLQMPNIQPVHIPTQKERNGFQSAGTLVKRLADTITEWRKALPEDQQPVICAILYNGYSINVHCLSEESFHGVKVEGTYNEMPCMVLVHQSSLQLLCFVEKVEKKDDRRKIGFIIDGERTDL